MIGRTADGRYRVIRREIFYNDEGYPLFATRIGATGFATAADARKHEEMAEPMNESTGTTAAWF